MIRIRYIEPTQLRRPPIRDYLHPGIFLHLALSLYLNGQNSKYLFTTKATTQSLDSSICVNSLFRCHSHSLSLFLFGFHLVWSFLWFVAARPKWYILSYSFSPCFRLVALSSLAQNENLCDNDFSGTKTTRIINLISSTISPNRRQRRRRFDKFFVGFVCFRGRFGPVFGGKPTMTTTMKTVQANCT